MVRSNGKIGKNLFFKFRAGDKTSLSIVTESRTRELRLLMLLAQMAGEA